MNVRGDLVPELHPLEIARILGVQLLGTYFWCAPVSELVIVIAFKLLLKRHLLKQRSLQTVLG